MGKIDVKKIYYYSLCAMAFFVLLWGVIDFTSSVLGLVNASISSASTPSSPAREDGEQQLDFYYQKKMLGDRLWDSVARVFVSGAIFVYCRLQANKTEESA